MTTFKLSRILIRPYHFYTTKIINPLNITKTNSNNNNNNGLLLLRGRYFGNSSSPPGPGGRQQSSHVRLTVIGMGVGATLGTLYATYNHLQKDKAHKLPANESTLRIIDRLPDSLKITRKIVNQNDSNDLDIILFQYQTCPFCCKVRAFLDSSGFTYSVVEVDAVLRQSLKWSTYKKVPMLLAKTKDGKYVQLTDSSMIISTLASFLADPQQDIKDLAAFYPTVNYVDDSGTKKSDVINKYFLMYQENIPKGLTKEQMNEERKWRSWADDHLVHLISPNVYRTYNEAMETFEWFSDVGEWNQHFPRWERNLMVYVGATAMWAISKRLKKRHNLSENVRWHLYKACNQWTDELQKQSGTDQKPFHGGHKPNLADLAVFGVLNSMEGCQAFADCLDNTKIRTWFYAMKHYVNLHKGTVISAAEYSQQQQQQGSVVAL